jgi:hypothetical protein
MCVAISGGCAVDEPTAPSQIEQTPLGSATPSGEVASGDVGGANPVTNGSLTEECICLPDSANLTQDESDLIVCTTGCGFCGDGLCSGSETPLSCSFDCGSFCGDGFCEFGESCPEDCGPVCGNGLCESGESSSSCPTDCGPVCGNGQCESGESSSSCSADCGPAPTPCGDGICKDAFSVTSTQAQARYAWGLFCRTHIIDRSSTRFLSDQSVTTYGAASTSLKPFLFPIYFNALNSTSWNVPDGAGTDCSLLPSATLNTALCVAGCYKTPVCGNGACETGESSSSCSADCPPPPVCGNGQCESGESSSSCSADCGPVCGDGLCHIDEEFSCSLDCGSVCGDGLCQFDEQFSCSLDCGSVCGDGLCQFDEQFTCSLDCGVTCIAPPCLVEQ